MTEYSPKISIVHFDADLRKLASSFHCVNQFDDLEEDMNVSPLYGNEDQAIPMYLALGLEP